MGHHQHGSRNGETGDGSYGRRLLISLAGTVFVVIVMLVVLLWWLNKNGYPSGF